MHEVTLYVDINHSLRHASHVYTGLFELAHQGKVSLRVRYPAHDAWQKAPPGGLCVHVELSRPGSRHPTPVCFDLADQSYRFYPQSLNSCAVYFKRSYFQPDVDGLSPEVRSRVIPFGLNYPSSNFRSYPALVRAMAREAVRMGRHPVQHRRRLWSLAGKLTHYLRLPRPAALECSPTAPKEEVVVFQPRLWEQSELIGECAETINEQRVAVVRALRRAFGSRFRGGLVPTSLAKRRYPDLVSEIHPRSYVPTMRRSLIGVYTRGLHHSTASKLGEYLAASLCVVAEPIRNAAASPLQVGHHYLSYSDPDGCVEACARILEDSKLQESMRAATHQYYVQNVEPAAHLLQCIERVRQMDL